MYFIKIFTSEEIKITNLLLLFLEDHSKETLAGKFITITPHKNKNHKYLKNNNDRFYNA